MDLRTRITEIVESCSADRNTTPIGNVRAYMPADVREHRDAFERLVRSLGFSVRPLWCSNLGRALPHVIISEDVLRADRARKRENDERGFVTLCASPAEVAKCSICGTYTRVGSSCCFDNGSQ